MRADRHTDMLITILCTPSICTIDSLFCQAFILPLTTNTLPGPNASSWCHTQTDNRFTALLYFVWDYPDQPTPERYHQEGKTSRDLLEQEIVSGSGISWAICKSAPRHASIPPLSFLQAGCPSCCPTNCVKCLLSATSLYNQ